MNFRSIHRQFFSRDQRRPQRTPGGAPRAGRQLSTAASGNRSQIDRRQPGRNVTSRRTLTLVLVWLVSATCHHPVSASDNENDSSKNSTDAVAATETAFSAADRSHWSFLPIAQPAVPTFTIPADQDWIRTPVDAFILARLQHAGLKPARQADRRILVRRLYFNLTGLPPAPADIAAFLNDDSPDAWERVVDQVLASPHYGEKWGQHWLDVVRFAESEGFEYDRHHAAAWRFRDYVIRSFNEDRPFNRFVTEQLAGDELAADTPGRDPLFDETCRDQLVAAGFHRLGPVRRNAGNPEIAFSRNEVLTEMTNAVGTVFLGLTIGCARCHDHFFDPIRQTDYYRLQAFLAATNEFDAPFANPREWSSRTLKRDAIEKQITSLKSESSSAPPDRAAEIKRQIT